MADSLAPGVVRPLLGGRFGRIYRYEELCPSTQRLLRENDPEGAVAVAEEQSEGRGRLGRSWQAPAGTSVLVSVLLRPPLEAARLPELSLVAGGAVAQAIADVTGIDPAIKFPNDVLVEGRKVAGILAESSDGRVVLGIGVNANQTREQLPADAQTEPTSLRLELGGPVDRATLLSAILLQLERAYDAWIRGAA
ncbi:MAG: biotin--[acetyl-CoA-carboxylase] ligase [Actinobacteria bacterium]|nr:MAG: biotin--[acetyl-CoA-carboxylase] ligase [Actinomycetota bacterium]